MASGANDSVRAYPLVTHAIIAMLMLHTCMRDVAPSHTEVRRRHPAGSMPAAYTSPPSRISSRREESDRLRAQNGGDASDGPSLSIERSAGGWDL